jgi:hypothetical protein
VIVYVGAVLVGLASFIGVRVQRRRAVDPETRIRARIDRDAVVDPVRPTEAPLVAWGDTMHDLPRAATEAEIAERHARQRELVDRARELEYKARHAAPAELSFAGLDGVYDDAAQQLHDLEVLAEYVAAFDEMEDRWLRDFNKAMDESNVLFNERMAELHREFVCGPRDA